MQVSPHGFPIQQTGCPFATISITPSIVDQRTTTTAATAAIIMTRISIVRMRDNMVLKSIITRKITSTITDIPLCITTHLLHLLVCLVFNFMCTLIVFFSVKFFRNRACLHNRFCRHSRAIDSTRHCLDSAGWLDCLDLGHSSFSSSPHLFGVLLLCAN